MYFGSSSLPSSFDLPSFLFDFIRIDSLYKPFFRNLDSFDLLNIPFFALNPLFTVGFALI